MPIIIFLKPLYASIGFTGPLTSVFLSCSPLKEIIILDLMSDEWKLLKN